MTVIATFEWAGHPILVADMLTTSRYLHRGLDAVPTRGRGNLNELMTDPLVGKAAGIEQKICIPHPHAMIGWAGNELKARRFCSALRDALREVRKVGATIRRFISSYPKTELSGCAFILIWRAAGGFKRELIGDHVTELKSPPLKNIALAGEGTPRLFDLLSTSAEALDAGFPRTVDAAIALGMCACAVPMINQAFNGADIERGWGGGFEFAYFDGTKFAKVDAARFDGMWLDRSSERIAPHFPKYAIAYDDGVALIENETNVRWIIDPFDRSPPKAISQFQFNPREINWWAFVFIENRRVSVAVRKVAGNLSGWEMTEEGRWSLSKEVVDELMSRTFTFVHGPDTPPDLICSQCEVVLMKHNKPLGFESHTIAIAPNLGVPYLSYRAAKNPDRFFAICPLCKTETLVPKEQWMGLVN